MHVLLDCLLYSLMCTLSVELDMVVQETATIENNGDEHAAVLKAVGGRKPSLA